MREQVKSLNKKKRQPLYAAVLQGAETGNAQCAGFLSLLERFRMLSATAPVGEVIETFFNETPILSAVRAMDGGALREENRRALGAWNLRLRAGSAPDALAELVTGCAAEGGRYLTLLFPAEDVLVTLDGGDLYMTVYNPGEEFLKTVSALASAEGLFVRKGAE